MECGVVSRNDQVALYSVFFAAKTIENRNVFVFGEPIVNSPAYYDKNRHYATKINIAIDENLAELKLDKQPINLEELKLHSNEIFRFTNFDVDQLLESLLKQAMEVKFMSFLQFRGDGQKLIRGLKKAATHDCPFNAPVYFSLESYRIIVMHTDGNYLGQNLRWPCSATYTDRSYLYICFHVDGNFNKIGSTCFVLDPCTSRENCQISLTEDKKIVFEGATDVALIDLHYIPMINFDEILCAGLAAPGVWNTFLTRGLYDPRLLVLVWLYADKTK